MLVREVVAGYGGACSCCGELELMFLTLDHVNDDGADSRREHVGHIWAYRDARRRGYPDDYRLLCINCNFGRHRNGGVCPHEEHRA